MNEKIAQAIIDKARSFLNTPYEYGENKTTGIDCSAMVQLIFLETIKKDIGRSAILQAANKEGFTVSETRIGAVVSEKDLQPADLIFFRGTKAHLNDELFPPEIYGLNMMIGHVGIYTGNGMVIHAAGGKIKKVVEEPLENVKKHAKEIKIIKRFI
ncbi:MAG: C40 family peptidase [bacterium]|nr:C40 family peptidase [bacterium]